MHWLTLLPQKKKIKVKSGTILLDAIRQAGFEILVSLQWTTAVWKMQSPYH